MAKPKIRHMLLLAILVAFAASFLFPGVGENETIQTSITFIGILFGIIVGFFIGDLYARYQGIRNNAAADSSALSTFYFMAQILGEGNEEWLSKVKNQIHSYIDKFMPLPWERYGETEEEFSGLGELLKEIEYDTDKKNETFSNILAVYSDHSTAREKLVMLGRDSLSWGEWLVTILLGGLLLVSLFYTKDSTFVSSVFTGSISSAILVLFIVLRDLNNMNFGQTAVSIEPYERVLDAIGEKRYFESKRQKFI